MKRLLVYLFLVLGLGLTFSVSANAKSLELCWKSLSGDKVWVTKEKNWSRGGSGCKRIHKSENAKLYKEINKNLFKTSLTFNKNKKKKIYSIRKINLQNILKNHNKNWNSWLYPNTKIAKAEPSQTQKVAKGNVLCFVDWPSNIDYPEYSISGNVFIQKLKYDDGSNCNMKIFKSKNKKLYNRVASSAREVWIGTQAIKVDDTKLVLRYIPYKTLNKIYDEQNLSLAKIYPKKKSYPSSKQVKGVIYCVNKPYSSIEKIRNQANIIPLRFKRDSAAFFFKTVPTLGENTSCEKLVHEYYVNVSLKEYQVLVNEFEINKELLLKGEEPLKIAKVKPKKKVKVAKVEDNTQEEFKPKKTNQDNEAPVIEIAEAITVNDSSYEFQGKVTDKAKTIYVEVDGRLVDVNKKGQFVVKGYSPIDKEISITAFDQWDNRSEPKIVKLTIDIKDTNVAEKLEPLNPSKIRSKSSNNKIALIIGIENYSEAPKANYANLDAKYFFDYARKAFGVKKQNIKMLIDQEASLSKTNSAIFKWLPGKITANETDLIIFFSGHGLASSDGKAKYILPSNADPDLLARTALSRSELFEEIIKLNPKSVTMFFDTCYSGVSRDEQTLLAAAKPLRGVVDDDNKVPDNFTIFTASKGDQISSGLKEAKHGIFSYYLMKGLEGKADANKDKDITNGELRAYMVKNVSDKALDLGRQQTPVLSGDPDKILMSYR
jgi:hypothetical protein